MINFATEAMEKPVLLIGGLAVSLVAYTVGTIVYRIWLHPLSKIPGPKLLAATDLPTMLRMLVQLRMSENAVQLHRKYGPIVRVGPDRVIIDGSIAWTQVFGVRSTSEADEFGKIPGYLIPNDHKSLIAAPPTIESRARKQETLDIVHWFNYVTFDMIGDLTFADSFGSMEGDTSFVDNLFLALQGLSIGVFLNWFPWMKVPMLLLMGPKLMVAQKAGLANEQLGHIKAQGRMAMDESIKESGRRDFSTYMLRRGKGGEEILSPDEVMINSTLLVLAGSETTATALSGAIFFLSRPENASKLQRLVDELCVKFSSESAIDITSTANLEYLMAVIEETMRMYPPAAALTPRQSPGAEVGGHWLPKGTIIHFNSKATHRNPDYFRDPDTFVPERWLSASHPFHVSRYDSDRNDVFKPFSAGARDCIGKNLAYAEMRTILSRLIFRFEFEVLPGQDDWMAKQTNSPIVWMKEGLDVRPSLRKLAVAEE
ncbi:aspirochlorine biosynthesis cytochrome P450 monooxygenase [Microdochium nivale]|nr:aspirochlorine biosynthesis cytochrome P450 monooxygenase [Microdochium nivale]